VSIHAKISLTVQIPANLARFITNIFHSSCSVHTGILRLTHLLLSFSSRNAFQPGRSPGQGQQAFDLHPGSPQFKRPAGLSSMLGCDWQG